MNTERELAEVLALLGKATPGPWTNSIHGDAHMGRLYGGPLDDRSVPALCKTWNAPDDQSLNCYIGIDQLQGMNNSAAIAAAVNFLRKHGPALLSRADGGEAPLESPDNHGGFDDLRTEGGERGSSELDSGNGFPRPEASCERTVSADGCDRGAHSVGLSERIPNTRQTSGGTVHDSGGVADRGAAMAKERGG